MRNSYSKVKKQKNKKTKTEIQKRNEIQPCIIVMQDLKIINLPKIREMKTRNYENKNKGQKNTTKNKNKELGSTRA